MINIRPINENNFHSVANLKLDNNQLSFVASPMEIIARAHAYKAYNSRAFAVYDDEIIVGIGLLCELEDINDSCYELQEFLIGVDFQNCGYGKKALIHLIEMLSEEGRHPALECCVKKDNKIMISVLKALGFCDIYELKNVYIFKYFL